MRHFTGRVERLGRLDQAIEHAQQSLAMFQAEDDLAGVAKASNVVGYLHAQVGTTSRQWFTASGRSAKAAEMIKEMRAPYWQVDVLVHLGDACQAGGEPEQCRHAWQEALAMMDDVHHPDADQVRAKLVSISG